MALGLFLFCILMQLARLRRATPSRPSAAASLFDDTTRRKGRPAKNGDGESPPRKRSRRPSSSSSSTMDIDDTLPSTDVVSTAAAAVAAANSSSSFVAPPLSELQIGTHTYFRRAIQQNWWEMAWMLRHFPYGDFSVWKAMCLPAILQDAVEKGVLPPAATASLGVCALPSPLPSFFIPNDDVRCKLALRWEQTCRRRRRRRDPMLYAAYLYNLAEGLPHTFSSPPHSSTTPASSDMELFETMPVLYPIQFQALKRVLLPPPPAVEAHGQCRSQHRAQHPLPHRGQHPPPHRLVCVSGPSGCGKTHLVVQTVLQANRSYRILSPWKFLAERTGDLDDFVDLVRSLPRAAANKGDVLILENVHLWDRMGANVDYCGFLAMLDNWETIRGNSEGKKRGKKQQLQQQRTVIVTQSESFAHRRHLDWTRNSTLDVLCLYTDAATLTPEAPMRFVSETMFFCPLEHVCRRYGSDDFGDETTVAATTATATSTAAAAAAAAASRNSTGWRNIKAYLSVHFVAKNLGALLTRLMSDCVLEYATTSARSSVTPTDPCPSRHTAVATLEPGSPEPGVPAPFSLTSISSVRGYVYARDFLLVSQRLTSPLRRTIATPALDVIALLQKATTPAQRKAAVGKLYEFLPCLSSLCQTERKQALRLLHNSLYAFVIAVLGSVPSCLYNTLYATARMLADASVLSQDGVHMSRLDTRRDSAYCLLDMCLRHSLGPWLLAKRLYFSQASTPLSHSRRTAPLDPLPGKWPRAAVRHSNASSSTSGPCGDEWAAAFGPWFSLSLAHPAKSGTHALQTILRRGFLGETAYDMMDENSTRQQQIH